MLEELVVTGHETSKILAISFAHLCIGGWRPLGKNYFDVSATFGRGAVIGPASLKRIECPRALMVVRGSESSHSDALDAHAQVRIFPILGLDRLPLRRRRSHQFKSPSIAGSVTRSFLRSHARSSLKQSQKTPGGNYHRGS